MRVHKLIPYQFDEHVRQCVACKRCYPPSSQLCRECFVELVSIDTVPYIIKEKYRLERVLSNSRASLALRATDLTTGQPVALKIWRACAMIDPRAYDRLAVEAELARGFTHQSLAKVLEYGRLPDASAYLVSEYVEGVSLRQELKRNTKLPFSRALAILCDAAEALDAAHKAGLVHRDLKPENIILLPKTATTDAALAHVRLKIVDFSLARIPLGQEFIPGTTAAAQIRGQLPQRPTYMSPEQFRGQEPDLRTDIFSLGAIGYEMLAGKPPYSEKRFGEVSAKILHTRPRSLHELNPEIDILAEVAIARALSRNPLQRQQRAIEIKRELMQFAQYD